MEMAETPEPLLLISVAASALFLAALPYNLRRLYHSSVKVHSSWIGDLKVVSLCVPKSWGTAAYNV